MWEISCRYCGNKFPLTSKNKLFCSKNHGVYWHNLEKRITKELDILESKFDCIPEIFEIDIENVKIKCENWDDEPFYCAIALDNDDYVHCFSTDDKIDGFGMYNSFEYFCGGDEKLLLFYPSTNEISIWRYLQVYINLLER